eukprot:116611-Prorocentrum_minimum.AAC.1
MGLYLRLPGGAGSAPPARDYHERARGYCALAKAPLHPHQPQHLHSTYNVSRSTYYNVGHSTCNVSRSTYFNVNHNTYNVSHSTYYNVSHTTGAVADVVGAVADVIGAVADVIVGAVADVTGVVVDVKVSAVADVTALIYLFPSADVRCRYHAQEGRPAGALVQVEAELPPLPHAAPLAVPPLVDRR